MVATAKIKICYDEEEEKFVDFSEFYLSSYASLMEGNAYFENYNSCKVATSEKERKL